MNKLDRLKEKLQVCPCCQADIFLDSDEGALKGLSSYYLWQVKYNCGAVVLVLGCVTPVQHEPCPDPLDKVLFDIEERVDEDMRDRAAELAEARV